MFLRFRYTVLHPLLCILLFLSHASSAQPLQPSAAPIWIDTDITFGRFGKDVDDGIALLMALGSPHAEIAGISVVNDTAKSARIARSFLSHQSPPRSIAVYGGANHAADLGKTTAAVEAMYAALLQRPMRIAALGPATNIATLLHLHPDIRPRIIEIVLCAGRSPGQALQPGRRAFTDYNFEMDTLAFGQLLHSGCPLVLAGYEASATLRIRKSDIRFLKKSPQPFRRYLYRHMRNWMTLWRIFMLPQAAFIPFDAATMAYLLHPSTLRCEPRSLSISHHPSDNRNIIATATKPYLTATPALSSTTPCIYCTACTAELKEIIISVFSEQ